MSIVAAAAAAAASASRRAASALAASSSASFSSSSSQRAAPALLNVASIEVPPNVSVTRKGSELTVTGPLGTSKTDLASLDGRGDGALKLSPDGRSIEVASVSKPFFGTLQTLLRNKIEVRRRKIRISIFFTLVDDVDDASLLSSFSFSQPRQPRLPLSLSLSLSLLPSSSLSPFSPGRHQGLLRPAPHRRHRLPRGPVPGRLHPHAQARPLARLRLRAPALAQGRRPGADAGGPLGPGQEPGDAGRGQRDRAEAAEPVQGEGGEGGGHERQAQAGEEEVKVKERVFFFFLTTLYFERENAGRVLSSCCACGMEEERV